MTKRSFFVRSVAVMVLVVMGLLGLGGMSENPHFLPTDDYSTKVEMLEVRFPPANWWGIG